MTFPKSALASLTPGAWIFFHFWTKIQSCENSWQRYKKQAIRDSLIKIPDVVASSFLSLFVSASARILEIAHWRDWTIMNISKRVSDICSIQVKHRGGSIKRQKRTALTDSYYRSSRSFKRENERRTEPRFFFLSSLFVLSTKTKKHFILSLPLSTLIWINIGGAALGKVRPLQIVTTPQSPKECFIFVSPKNTLVCFSSNRQRSSQLKQVLNTYLL